MRPGQPGDRTRRRPRLPRGRRSGPGLLSRTIPSLRTDSNTAFGEDVQARLPPDGRLRLGRLRHHSEDPDGHRRYPLVLLYEEYEEGSEYYSESTSTPDSLLNHANGVCIAAGLCGFSDQPAQERELELDSWANLTWHITPDVMAYYTWSQGFRPGGFNRTDFTDRRVVSTLSAGGRVAGQPRRQGHRPDLKPAGYNSDIL